MSTQAPPSVSGFWRCRKCRTPNPRAAYLSRCLGCGRAVPSQAEAGPSSPGPSTRRSEPRAARGRWVGYLAAYYGAFVLLAWAVLRTVELSWWVVPGLLFMPRWLFLVPIVPLALGAAWSRGRWVAALVVVDGLLVLGPLMGFAVPWRRLMTAEPVGPRVRIMTFNRAGRALDAPGFIRYLERHRIDVVCFQEPGASEEIDAYFAEGWHLDRDRRIASRFPILAEIPGLPDDYQPDERISVLLDRVRLLHPEGFAFVVGSAHLPTVRRGYQRLRGRDFRGFRLHLDWWDEQAARLVRALSGRDDLPMIVGGDFNMPADASTMAAIRSTFPSAFDVAGWGYGYTRPASHPWVRIDHILAGREWTFTRSWVGPDLGSDHLPIVAEAVLTSPTAAR